MKINILLLLLLPSLVYAEYKVPLADDQQSSPPVISGPVLNVTGNTVTIKSEGKKVNVLTNGDTQIFTEYGGHVLINQICNLENIEIWYNHPNANIKTDIAIAIRVQRKCP